MPWRNRSEPLPFPCLSLHVPIFAIGCPPSPPLFPGGVSCRRHVVSDILTTNLSSLEDMRTLPPMIQVTTTVNTSSALTASTETIPDLTGILKPDTFGDIAAYTFFGLGAVVLGGEIGLLTGSWSAARTIRRDPESRKRIETAFRKFKADALRRQADSLDKQSEEGREFIWGL